MKDAPFTIGAEGVDVDRIVSEIHATVEEKTRQGLYRDPRVARAERHNLAHIKDDEEFLQYYLDSLRDAVFVDINDFEIAEKRTAFAPLLVAIKRTLWTLLRFYTYRLWSQQNQVNGLLLSAVESTEARFRGKIAQLEARIRKLETGPGDEDDDSPDPPPR